MNRASAYQKLFDDVLKRVPAHSPEWTNHNQSDPGRALIELFAWLGDALLYRSDSIPESPRTILRMLAVCLRTRRCAHMSIVDANKTARTAPVPFVASRPGRSLYRVDLARIASKYIGETEKNLRQLLNAAEKPGAILFFDEADALFGKRSEVKDSHDRYARIKISGLLKRLETFKSMAILASSRCHHRRGLEGMRDRLPTETNQ